MLGRIFSPVLCKRTSLESAIGQGQLRGVLTGEPGQAAAECTPHDFLESLGFLSITTQADCWRLYPNNDNPGVTAFLTQLRVVHIGQVCMFASLSWVNFLKREVGGRQQQPIVAAEWGVA